MRYAPSMHRDTAVQRSVHHCGSAREIGVVVWKPALLQYCRTVLTQQSMNDTLLHVSVLVGAWLIVVLCVTVHYEALRFLGRTLGAHVHRRIGILLVMLGLLIAHMIEIWIFALGYRIAAATVGFGHLIGIDNPGI